MQILSYGATPHKRPHAQTLPENGALHSQKAEPIRDSWEAFNSRIVQGHERATKAVHTLDQLLEQSTVAALRSANEFGLLNPFPLTISEESTSLDYLSAHADVLALEINELITESEDIEQALPLLRLLALRLLREDNADFVDSLKEMVSSIIEESSAYFPEPLAPSYLAGIFEKTLVRLFNEKLDRLAVVIRTMRQHTRPSITEEEVKADHTLGLVLRHWEREHAPTFAALETEKAQLEAWFATEWLETAYWWARGVDDGLSDCDVVKPAIALVLDHWRHEGLADAAITVDAIWNELFKVEE